MSDPYGGPEPGERPSYPQYGDPSGSNPYGSNPYGSPYGGAPASPYGPAGSGPSTDAVSITGFVLSLLCCTGFVGVVLGIIGLRRTRHGVRSGRWAAVAAIVIGVIGTIATVGGTVAVVWFGTNTVFVDSADIGQCVDVSETFDHDATMWKKDCDEGHEAEIAGVGSFTAAEAAAYDEDRPAAVCRDRLRTDYLTAYATGEYYLGIVFEASEPDAGDAFVCYLERSDGDELTAPIG